MAEDGNDSPQETEDEYEDVGENEAKPKKKSTKSKSKSRIKPCNVRLDELSKPKRWCILGTYRDYGDKFEPKRMLSLKERVQEAFCMSPEETELYFASMRQKPHKKKDTRAEKIRIRKAKQAGKREAYEIIYQIIYKAMKYAHTHAPPLLVTPMLRIVSDHILELLANLHSIPVPKRTDGDHLSQFLIAVSDWTGIFVSNVYYEIEIEEQKDIERFRLLNEEGKDDSETTLIRENSKLALMNKNAQELIIKEEKIENVKEENVKEETLLIENTKDKGEEQQEGE